ncbi:MAG: biotin--[acetyl-CoA-carboxylase] ligase [Rubrobacteraceae bacterium]
MTNLLTQSAVERLNSPLARRVEFHDEVASTQDLALELAHAGAPHGTLVISRIQTGGHGRLGRSWGSPPGGIWMSIVLRPELEARYAPRMTQAAAVGVAKALHEIGVEARIKWPNDLLVEGKKICGILAVGGPAARREKTYQTEFVILGIGLNANLDPSDLGVSVEQAATIRSVLGHDVDLLELLDSLLSHLEHGIRHVKNFEPILRDWREFNCTLGERVRVRRSGQDFEGLALDLNPHGALRVATETGTIDLFEGEIEYVRPHSGDDGSE